MNIFYFFVEIYSNVCYNFFKTVVNFYAVNLNAQRRFDKEDFFLKAYNAKDIRNIAIAGHGGRGKTTLAEAMLYTAKATDRLGRGADGTTVLDFDAEEKKRFQPLLPLSSGTARR